MLLELMLLEMVLELLLLLELIHRIHCMLSRAT